MVFEIAFDYGDRLIALGQFKDSLTAMAPHMGAGDTSRG